MLLRRTDKWTKTFFIYHKFYLKIIKEIQNDLKQAGNMSWTETPIVIQQIATEASKRDILDGGEMTINISRAYTSNYEGIHTR